MIYHFKINMGQSGNGKKMLQKVKTVKFIFQVYKKRGYFYRYGYHLNVAAVDAPYLWKPSVYPEIACFRLNSSK